MTTRFGNRELQKVPEADLRAALVELYAKIAEMTWEDCQETCTRQPRFSCCHDLFCRITVEYAHSIWGVNLQSTGHLTLPLMGPKGCTAAPHFRPICAVHCCEVIPSEPGPPIEGPWREKYQTLKHYLEALETELVRRCGDESDRYPWPR